LIHDSIIYGNPRGVGLRQTKLRAGWPKFNSRQVLWWVFSLCHRVQPPIQWR